MSLKSAYKNASPWVQILIFIGSFILGSVISSFIGSFVIILQEIGNLKGMQSLDDISGFMQSLLENTAYLKQLQFHELH